MTPQHKELASGRWSKLSFCEQMANIGSEVERAMIWRAKNNTIYSNNAFERALELADLTLEAVSGFTRLKEVSRMREAVVDYFSGANQFGSTDASWRKYFSHFTYAVRKNY